MKILFSSLFSMNGKMAKPLYNVQVSGIRLSPNGSINVDSIKLGSRTLSHYANKHLIVTVSDGIYHINETLTAKEYE